MANVLESYSAVVRSRLEAAGHVFDVARVSPTGCDVRNPMQVDPCDAELIVEVDGKPLRWAVRLTKGISPDQPYVEYEDR